MNLGLRSLSVLVTNLGSLSTSCLSRQKPTHLIGRSGTGDVLYWHIDGSRYILGLEKDTNVKFKILQGPTRSSGVMPCYQLDLLASCLLPLASRLSPVLRPPYGLVRTACVEEDLHLTTYRILSVKARASVNGPRQNSLSWRVPVVEPYTWTVDFVFVTPRKCAAQS